MRTHVTFVLDSSGSMSKIREDTIGGFNTFLEDQQGEPGEATVTLYDFNNSVERVYHGKSIKGTPQLDEEIEELTEFSPGSAFADGAE
jgi:hypothetical protein